MCDSVLLTGAGGEMLRPGGGVKDASGDSPLGNLEGVSRSGGLGHHLGAEPTRLRGGDRPSDESTGPGEGRPQYRMGSSTELMHPQASWALPATGA